MYQKTVLDNGLRIVTSAMPHTRSVCISLFIGTGSRYEEDAEGGISHFIEHLLFKGSEKRPNPGEISAAIEGIGGILNGGTDKELTVYWCKVAQDRFSQALDVLTDMLLHPIFEPKEIDKERHVIIEEINMSKDSPAQEVNILIDELLFSGHPLGRDIAGTRESVSAISREHMLDYLFRYYQPQNTVASIAGNIKHEKTIEEVAAVMTGWTSEKLTHRYRHYRPKPANRIKIENRDIEQAHLCLAIPGLSIVHPERFKLDLLNIILGQGMSSRLFTEIRDRMGLAYSIHSYVEHFLDSGALTIYAGVDTRKLMTAITAILEQMNQIKLNVSDAELTRAKEISRGRLLLRMEDSHNVAGWLGGQEVLTGKIFTPEEVTSIVDAITTEEIETLANNIFDDKKLCLAIVGPVAGEERLLEVLRF